MPEYEDILETISERLYGLAQPLLAEVGDRNVVIEEVIERVARELADERFEALSLAPRRHVMSTD